eukprot:5107310-Prymnesium_polylepis.1
MASPREVVDAARASPATRRATALEGGRTRKHKSNSMGDDPAAPLRLGLGDWLCGAAGWALGAALIAAVAM